MGIVVRLPFVPPWYLPQRRPSRLRRSGRDITAALISTNYLLFNIGWYWSVLAGSESILGSTGQYLVVLGHYWVVLVSTWWYWVIIRWYWVNIGWCWSVFVFTRSILGGTGQYFVFLGQYWIVLVKTTPKTTENHQKEPTSWLLLTGNSFVAKKLVPGQNVAPWRTPPGQNVAPMNTHDRLQNRLQARHIVPGQYMSWDNMSRDKRGLRRWRRCWSPRKRIETRRLLVSRPSWHCSDNAE